MHGPSFLAAVLALVPAAPSQQPPTQAPPQKVDAPDGIEKAKYPGAPVAKPKPYVVRTGDIDQPENPAKNSGVRGKAIALSAFAKPASVAPGETGSLLFVFAPAGEAMLLDPAPVRFTFASVQDGIEFPAQPAFAPSTPSTKAAKLKGVKVYGDTAMAEMPFRVSQGATTGPRTVTFQIGYELIAGTGGGLLGPFTDVVTAQIEVLAPAQAAVPVAAAAPPTPAGDAAATALPAGSAVVAPTAPPLESPAAVVGGSSFLLLGGGAGLLGLLALLALRRRER